MNTIKSKIYIVVCVALTLLGIPYQAVAGGSETDAIVTDRPDFTESSSAVAPDKLQIEAGAQVSDTSNVTSITPVNVLARFGLFKSTEVRFGFIPTLLTKVGRRPFNETTLPEVSVGSKFAGAFTEKVNVGLLPKITGSGLAQDFDNSTFRAGVIGTASLELFAPIGVGLNAGIFSIPSASNTREI